jgi:hypothetical protein
MDMCVQCGKKAQWIYTPDGVTYCDDCVPRGCSCNHEYVNDIHSLPLPEKESDYKWIEEGVYWCYVDDKGREYPCCEFDELLDDD